MFIHILNWLLIAYMYMYTSIQLGYMYIIHVDMHTPILSY